MVAPAATGSTETLRAGSSDFECECCGGVVTDDLTWPDPYPPLEHLCPCCLGEPLADRGRDIPGCPPCESTGRMHVRYVLVPRYHTRKTCRVCDASFCEMCAASWDDPFGVICDACLDLEALRPDLADVLGAAV